MGTDENLLPVHLNATSHGVFLSEIIDGEDIIAIISGFGSWLIFAITTSTIDADLTPLG